MKNEIARLVNRAVNYEGSQLKYLCEQTHKISELVDEHISLGRLLGDSSEISFRRKSDRLFILGSGPSADSICQKGWDIVRGGDVLGFNSSFKLPIHHDLYLDQHLLVNKSTVALDSFSDTLSGCHFLVRGGGFSAEGLREEAAEVVRSLSLKAYGIRELPFHSETRTDFFSLFSFLQALGLLNFGHLGKFVPKFGATLGVAVPLAIQLGYPEIVLIGVDLRDRRHFATWGRDRELTFAGMRTHPQIRRGRGMHMGRLLGSLNSWLETSTTISVANPNSALTEYLPEFYLPRH